MNLPAAPRAVLADDEPHLARALAAQLAELWPELRIVHLARHGLEAAQRIAELEPEVAFLDIQMPGLTGLEVAQDIMGKTQVVFVTAYDDYAVPAFEHEAVDYLLKPVNHDRLARCVARLQRRLAQPAPEDGALAGVLRRLAGAGAAAAPLRWIRASAGELTHQIDVSDVLFFQADDKYTCVRTAHAEHLIRTTIVELSQQLDPEFFWQIHRSTLVNLRHLAGTRRDENSRLFVRLHGHAGELPVSRAYVHRFKAM